MVTGGRLEVNYSIVSDKIDVWQEKYNTLTNYLNVNLHNKLQNPDANIAFDPQTGCGVSSLNEYKKLLIKDKEQREKFLDFITINVTEFFRNPELFLELKNHKDKTFTKKSKVNTLFPLFIECDVYLILLDNDSHFDYVPIMLPQNCVVQKNPLWHTYKGIYALYSSIPHLNLE